MVQDSELVSLLGKAKHELMRASQRAGDASQWERGKRLFQCASDIDAMIGILQGNGSAPPSARPMATSPRSIQPTKLPYFFVDGNNLAKIGPSRDGSTYRHNVT